VRDARESALGSTRDDEGRRGTRRRASRCARVNACSCVCTRVCVFFYASYGALTLGSRVSFARAVITEVTPK